jgi:hypothetical protein
MFHLVLRLPLLTLNHHHLQLLPFPLVPFNEIQRSLPRNTPRLYSHLRTPRASAEESHAAQLLKSAAAAQHAFWNNALPTALKHHRHKRSLNRSLIAHFQNDLLHRTRPALKDASLAMQLLKNAAAAQRAF